MYYKNNKSKKKNNHFVSILGGKKYKKYTKKLVGGILDESSIEKSKKIKKSLYNLKNNSKKIGHIAENSLNHFLDLAYNSTDIAQNALINTYKILAPNANIEKEIRQEILKNKPKNKCNKKYKKSRKQKKYINEWQKYNR